MSARYDWLVYRQRHELARRNGRAQRECPGFETDWQPSTWLLVFLWIGLPVLCWLAVLMICLTSRL